ncbi:MAG: beta-ketoacyl-ACP synthase [Acidimicrobiales bacterium]|nr:MAG: beta-ketoacyl-ACP synthase [Acidimicrobiales bacterium]
MNSHHECVVVTGLGATTPLGGDVASTWDGLLAGRCGVRALETQWAQELPVKIAASLAQEPTEKIKPVQARRMDRCTQVAIVAAREAWADAGTPEIDPERLAVAVGSGFAGVLTVLSQEHIRRTDGYKRVSPLSVPMLMPNGPAAMVGLDLGARAGAHTTVSACASGAESLSLGLDIIRAGRADMVLVGGAEACIHPLVLSGFSQMRALSTRNDEPQRASRPFDKARDGFVLAEGAGAIVLERADHAQARGVRIYAALAGAGVTSDAHDVVQPHPQGAGAARAITAALRAAGLDRRDVTHVNAHATSTPAGDAPEAEAIRAAIGDHAVVTAPKGSLGHLLGAAGTVEAIATVLAIYHGVIPPTINLEELDERVRLDIATKPREATIQAAVNDSFGFGGHNVAVAFTAV